MEILVGIVVVLGLSSIAPLWMWNKFQKEQEEEERKHKEYMERTAIHRVETPIIPHVMDLY